MLSQDEFSVLARKQHTRPTWSPRPQLPGREECWEASGSPLEGCSLPACLPQPLPACLQEPQLFWQRLRGCFQWKVLSFLFYFTVVGMGKILGSKRPVHAVFTAFIVTKSTEKPQNYYFFWSNILQTTVNGFFFSYPVRMTFLALNIYFLCQKDLRSDLKIIVLWLLSGFVTFSLLSLTWFGNKVVQNQQ